MLKLWYSEVSGSVRASEVVRRSKLVMQVGVGSQVLGRIINPLGSAIDGLGEIAFEGFRPIEKKRTGYYSKKSYMSLLKQD